MPGLVFRIFVGAVFLVSGAEKVLGPSGNFLYVIQSYELLPLSLARWVSVVFPWIEFLTGVFLLLGLWIRPAILSAMAMSAGFMVFVIQALARSLPLDSCGCFGELVHLKPKQVLFLDAWMFWGMTVSWRRFKETVRWSLDGWFDRA